MGSRRGIRSRNCLPTEVLFWVPLFGSRYRPNELQEYLSETGCTSLEGRPGCRDPPGLGTFLCPPSRDRRFTGYLYRQPSVPRHKRRHFPPLPSSFFLPKIGTSPEVVGSVAHEDRRQKGYLRGVGGRDCIYSQFKSKVRREGKVTVSSSTRSRNLRSW